MKELMNIQNELKAPKGQFNKFGGYKYRSAEDILEAVKPILFAHKCTLTISDAIVNLGDRYYIEATATLTNEEGKVTQTSAFAREEETKKGMDGAQITGSASSYARKYALNGLFCIDDTKDPDATNDHGKSEPKPDIKIAVQLAENAKDAQELMRVWNLYKDAFGEHGDFKKAVANNPNNPKK